MKKIALTLSVLGLVSAASFAQIANAAPSNNTNDLTTAQVRQIVQQNGAVVLATGNGLYDRYVSNVTFCAPHEETRRAFVPTSDSHSAAIGYTCTVENDRR